MKKQNLFRLAMLTVGVLASTYGFSQTTGQNYVATGAQELGNTVTSVKQIGGYAFTIIGVILFIMGVYTVATDSQNTKRVLISMGMAFVLMTIGYVMGFAS